MDTAAYLACCILDGIAFGCFLDFSICQLQFNNGLQLLALVELSSALLHADGRLQI